MVNCESFRSNYQRHSRNDVFGDGHVSVWHLHYSRWDGMFQGAGREPAPEEEAHACKRCNAYYCGQASLAVMLKFLYVA